MLKKITVLSFALATACAALAAPHSAAAADLSVAPLYKAPPPQITQVYNWTGFYLGANGGGGWGHSWWDANATGINTSGGLVGGTAGYNWQFGNTVLGLEGDLDWANLKGTASSTLCPNGCTTSDSWLSTVRGRAGYAFGQFLPYAMVGLAVGRFDYATTSTVTDDQTNPVATFGPVTTTDSQNNKFGYGYVYGLGMDVAITPSMFLRGEWEYVAFNKVGDIRSTLSTARVGLGVRF
jgi:outer membrane immunogenic protein